MQKGKSFDLSVYFVADPSLCGSRDIVDVVRAAAEGGVTLVQLRNKTGNEDEITAQARRLLEILKPLKIPLLINDYPYIAAGTGVDGVHLGQGDMDARTAGGVLGPGKIVGITAFAEDHMQAINPAIVDYVGTGPFYETKTDKGKPVLGADKFKHLVNLSPVPVVGIGGITADNAGAVIDAGASGVAMMRAISEADDPKQAAQDFVRSINNARMKKAS